MKRHFAANHAEESKRLSGHVCHLRDIWNDFVIEAVRRWNFDRCNGCLFVAVITAKILDFMDDLWIDGSPLHDLNSDCLRLAINHCVQALNE